MELDEHWEGFIGAASAALAHDVQRLKSRLEELGLLDGVADDDELDFSIAADPDSGEINASVLVNGWVYYLEGNRLVVERRAGRNGRRREWSYVNAKGRPTRWRRRAEPPPPGKAHLN